MGNLWIKGQDCDIYSNVGVAGLAYRVADILVLDVRYGLNSRVLAFRVDGKHIIVDCNVTPRPEEYIVALKSYAALYEMSIVHI